jgi:cytochrome c556
MRNKLFLSAVVIVGDLLVLGASVSAQVKQGKTRPLETKLWMKGVNGPHCSALKKVLDAGPADDEAWSTAMQHAQILNEAGHVLMADGRCPDAVWADASKQLRESSDAVLEAIAARNVAEARSSFQGVLGSCKTCHGAHKPKK